MTRNNLVEILKMDGTYQEIEEAIIEKELSESEMDRILEYLKEEDQEKAKELFDAVLKDVEESPIHESDKNSKKAWREYRLEIANEIKGLNEQAMKCQEHIDQCHKSLETAREVFGKDACAELEKMVNEDIDKTSSQLMIKTKQISALSLMYTESKSKEAQAMGRVFLEDAKPVRQALGYAWEGVRFRANNVIEHVGTSIEHSKNFRQIDRETNNLSFHPIQNATNKIRLAFANQSVKELNRCNAKIDKIEQKMIKTANKIKKAEVKPTFMEKLEHWSRGEKIERVEPEKVTDIERAKEILKNSEKYANKWMRRKSYALANLTENRDNAKMRAEKHMNRVAEILKDRKAEAQIYKNQYQEQKERGDFGNVSRRKDNIMAENLQHAFDSSVISEQSLSKDLREFIRNNKDLDLNNHLVERSADEHEFER